MFEFLDISVDPPELPGDRNALRALGDALLAADAVVSLTECRDGPVVTNEVSLA